MRDHSHTVWRSDGRFVTRLVSECIALGDDAIAWRRHAMESLLQRLGAKAAIGNEMADLEALAGQKWRGVPRVAPIRTGEGGPIRIGFTESELAVWSRYAEETPVHVTPEFAALSKGGGARLTRLRSDMWDDASWYRSRTYREFHEPAGIDDYVISVFKIPGADRSSSLWLHGAVGGARFGRRAWYVVSAVHRAIVPLIGGPLASTLQATPSTLPSRRRQVFELLLMGMSEKETAQEMGIGAATVHEHVQAIYRHFEVSSRAELMAHVIARHRFAGAVSPGVDSGSS